MTRAAHEEPSAGGVTIVWRRGDAFVARSGHLVGVRWTGVPEREQLAALAEAHADARRTGRSVLLVDDVLALRGGATRVDPRTYERMIALVQEARAQTRAVAHVIEVPGLIGAAVRTFLTTLERVAGDGRTATAAFDTPEAAAAWLARVDGAVSPRGITAAWRAMERAVAAPIAA